MSCGRYRYSPLFWRNALAIADALEERDARRGQQWQQSEETINDHGYHVIELPQWGDDLEVER